MDKRVAIASLGCPKNEVDSELMAGFLAEKGFEIVDVTAGADVIIINTCGFITDAKEESIETILSLARLKKRGWGPRLLVAGCLSQRYGQELLADMEEIDGVMGTGEVPLVAEIVGRMLKGERVLAVGTGDHRCEDHRVRLHRANSATAYVKIAEGCDNYCAYCAIPYIRGPFRSRPAGAVEEEVRHLAQKGVKEIILVAQETTRYGLDIYGELKLTDLVKRLVPVEGIQWIRLLYCYPTGITGELLEVMAREDKVCKYIDLPLQHACDDVLRRMNRRGSRQEILRLIEKMRSTIPGLSLRTTFIAGYPGETREEFEELLRFMEEVKFERAGIFAYSPEEGTPAASMPGQVAEEVKQARLREAMMLQQGISHEHNRGKLGRELKVLAEGFDTGLGMYTGRTEADAPEIDGQVFFSGSGGVSPGKMVTVRVTGFDEYDLTGELVNESAQ